VQPLAGTPSMPAASVWRARVAAVTARLPLGAIAWGAIALGVALRVATFFLMDPRADGATYTAMGHAWAETGAFLMPYGDVTTSEPTPPGLSHHYPPLYPLYLGLWYKALGFSLATTKLAAIALSIATLAVVYVATRDLYGARLAETATAIAALEPHLVLVTGLNFSENLVLAFFVGTMWAILKSLEDNRYIVFAGLFAGLAYLTRASMGYFFVVAGFAGLAWRLWHRGVRVLADKHYLAAIAIFGAMVLAWAWRNVSAFGWPHWETSSYTTWIQGCLLGASYCTHPANGYDWWEPPPAKSEGFFFAADPVQLFLHALAWKAPLFAAFILAYAAFFPAEVARAARRIREEHESGLWLSVLLVAAISLFMASLFWTYEQYDIWWLDNHRYFVIAVVPLAWAMLRHARFASGGFRVRAVALLVVLALVAGQLFSNPQRWSEAEAARALSPHLEAGDAVALDGPLIKYSFYPYVEEHDLRVYAWSQRPQGEWPDWIISLAAGSSYEGYTLFLERSVVYRDGGVLETKVFKRTGT